MSARTFVAQPSGRPPLGAVAESHATGMPAELQPRNAYSEQRMGVGFSYAHIGEMFQGVVEDSEGRFTRALVTLPCRQFSTHATFVCVPSGGRVRVRPETKVKSQHVAELTLDFLGRERDGELNICSTIPENKGMGSSTADAKATCEAVASAVGVKLSPTIVAQICVAAEHASDPLMFSDNRALLFAHREGRVLEEFGAMPELTVVGFDADQTGTGVSTLELSPASYDWRLREEFRVLRARLRRGIAMNDPVAIGSVASRSAAINQFFLANPRYEFTVELVERVGGVGFAIAHSGTVVGVLFDPRDPLTNCRVENCRLLLEYEGIRSWFFQTRREPFREVAA